MTEPLAPHPTGRRIPSLLSTLSAGLLVLLLTGCAGGLITTTAYTTAGTAAGILYEKRMAFRDQLHRDYQTYQSQFAEAECDPSEYEISDTIYRFIENSPGTVDGYAEAQHILKTIYHDETHSRTVRAQALYYTALTEVEKENGSLDQARTYLRQLKEDFPGTHDCAVDTLLDEEGII
ncbi:hypothetical protein CF392_02065 [Tamilnaduibacter salinus]|uniref:Tetratricopeptide repeat protein n=1 Tax=Tamilnaduibacter salinus TaxID=1484056 RepID=A0A2A2I7F9_9GAMM|nr:hypothetical protein [Tamilnaduibacter salinus]PAV27256.1 hypothetical protein CF392_02065 [Tamilnaduibacter salinus]